MLTRAAFQFKELNALVASTSRMNGLCFFTIEDSSQSMDSSLTYNWTLPAASLMSWPITDRTALLMILLSTSATPIGLTPGFLVKPINLQAV